MDTKDNHTKPYFFRKNFKLQRGCRAFFFERNSCLGHNLNLSLQVTLSSGKTSKKKAANVSKAMSTKASHGSVITPKKQV